MPPGGLQMCIRYDAIELWGRCDIAALQAAFNLLC